MTFDDVLAQVLEILQRGHAVVNGQRIAVEATDIR
jgi:hypothetical protein